MQVRLCGIEIFVAALVGIYRRLKSMERGISDDRGFVEDAKANRWDREIEGAAAEMAVAKEYNLYWDIREGRFKQPDVGDLHVRRTRRLRGRLIIRPGDPVDEGDNYILAVGSIPTFRLAGWMNGKAARTPEWLEESVNGGPPAWFVPQSALRSMGELEVAR